MGLSRRWKSDVVLEQGFASASPPISQPPASKPAAKAVNGHNTTARLAFGLNLNSTLVLDLTLPNGTSTVFSVRPHVALDTLIRQIKEEHPSIQHVAVFAAGESGAVGHKWARATCIDDVIREGLRAKHRGFIIDLDGYKVNVEVPSFEERTAPLHVQLEQTKAQLAPLDELKTSLDTQANKTSDFIMNAGLAFLVVQWVALVRLTWWESSWDTMEPVCYFMSTANAILGYIWYIIFKKDYTYESLANITATKRQQKLYTRHGLNLVEWSNLKDKVTEIEAELESIRQEYD